jgi:hypothetical protein
MRRCAAALRLAALLLFAASGTAAAADITIYAAPTGFGLAAPEKGGGPSPVDIYSTTAPHPDWFIGQWANASGRLPPFQPLDAQGVPGFVSRDKAAGVTFVGGRYTFFQNGPLQPCTTRAGRPHEFDLFAGTAAARMNPILRNAEQAPAPALTLGAMRRLDQHVAVEVIGETAGSGTRCKVNQGVVLTAVTLSNTIARPPQVLFYQLSLRLFCGEGPLMTACRNNRVHPSFWARGEAQHDAAGHATVREFGYDQRLPQLGRPFIPVGQRLSLDIDLLPDLLRIITAGENGLDRDPAHWRIGGAYHGQSVWGDVSLSTAWDSYRLTASER